MTLEQLHYKLMVMDDELEILQNKIRMNLLMESESKKFDKLWLKKSLLMEKYQRMKIRCSKKSKSTQLLLPI
mgnify:CR=1 FL=1